MKASSTMFLAAGPLALYGAWVLSVAIPQTQWRYAVPGLIAIVTAGGLLRLKLWAQAVTYVFAMGLAVEWFYLVGQVISRGWPYATWSETLASLLPGALLLVFCGGGSWIVHKQYRQLRKT